MEHVYLMSMQMIPVYSVADYIIVEIRPCFEILLNYMHSTLQVAGHNTVTFRQHIIFSVLNAIPSSVQPLTPLGTLEEMQNNFSTTARQLSAFEIFIQPKSVLEISWLTQSKLVETSLPHYSSDRITHKRLVQEC